MADGSIPLVESWCKGAGRRELCILPDAEKGNPTPCDVSLSNIHNHTQEIVFSSLARQNMLSSQLASKVDRVFSVWLYSLLS